MSKSLQLMMNEQGMTAIQQFAGCMASGQYMVPRELQGNTPDCMGIVMQAMDWGMNPFHVAGKTSVIKGKLCFEAQLINAAILKNAPLDGRPRYEWGGPWENVIGSYQTVTNDSGNKVQKQNWTKEDESGCYVKISAKLDGEDEPFELTLYLGQVGVRNSTLWATDPKQQLAYLALKKWVRLYCPDVIMGAYSPDEMQQAPEKDITPAQTLSEQSAGQVPDMAALPEQAQIDTVFNEPEAVQAVLSKIETCGDLVQLKMIYVDINGIKSHLSESSIAEIQAQYDERKQSLKDEFGL